MEPAAISSSTASREAICVSPECVSEVWNHVSHFIKEAIRRGDLGTFWELENAVLNNRALLWISWNEPDIEAAAVTQIVITECSKVCMVQACGGCGVNNWIFLLEKIEAYAVAEECDCVRIMGRKGWARLLKNYKTEKIVLERRL